MALVGGLPDTALLARLLGLLGLLLVGTGLRAVGVLNESRAGALNAAAYYVALPALIFVSTYSQSLTGLLTPTLVAGHVLVVFAMAGLAWTVHRNEASASKRSVAIVQSYHANVGYLGLPLVAATFDDTVTAIASIILGVVSLVQVPLTLLVLVAVNEADVPLRRELTQLFVNPVLVSLAAGLAVAGSNVTVPTGAVAGLDVLGAFALPLALLCVGAALDVDASAIDFRAAGSVAALKVLVMPAVAWVAFSLLGAGDAQFTASVVMLGTPTAVSTFVYAGELGGDTEFASVNVFATTLASIVTLFALVALVG